MGSQIKIYLIDVSYIVKVASEFDGAVEGTELGSACLE